MGRQWPDRKSLTTFDRSLVSLAMSRALPALIPHLRRGESVQADAVVRRVHQQLTTPISRILPSVRDGLLPSRCVLPEADLLQDWLCSFVQVSGQVRRNGCTVQNLAPEKPAERRSLSGGHFVLLAALLALLIVTVVWTTTVWTSSNSIAISKHGWIALSLGTFFSLVIGCGLMALMFYSSRSGHDEAATPKFMERRGCVLRQVGRLVPNAAAKVPTSTVRLCTS
jgi:hypothetical protein